MAHAKTNNPPPSRTNTPNGISSHLAYLNHGTNCHRRPWILKMLTWVWQQIENPSRAVNQSQSSGSGCSCFAFGCSSRRDSELDGPSVSLSVINLWSYLRQQESILSIHCCLKSIMHPSWLLSQRCSCRQDAVKASTSCPFVSFHLLAPQLFQGI